jgi:spore germination protein YaaH
MLKPLLVFILVVSSLFTQERKSIHQLDWENHQYLKKGNADVNIFDENIIPLQQVASANLSRKVFGYLPDWEYPEAMANLRFDLLTHIATFDFKVGADGSIGNPSGWPWTDLINKAHNNGVKVILTAVNFNGDEIHAIITDETVKNNFFNNLKNKITSYKLDGVNIDFESLNYADRSSVINNFMAELTTFIHENFPEGEVSFAGPAVNWSDRWDFTGLANACDYIFIMGYSFAGSWSSSSGSTAPLIGGSINITNTVQEQYAEVVSSMPQKLILGVPYYGVKFQTQNNQAHSSVTNYISSTRFRNSKSGFENYGTLWDSSTKSPWYRYQNNNDWFQVWCDNGRSIGEKFDLADKNNLLGVGMWALNYDGNQSDYWNEIIKHYGDDLPLPGEPQNFHVSPYHNNAVKISFSDIEYAVGYWIYTSEDGIVFSDSTYFNSTENILDGLTKDMLYYFKVRALSNAGLGPETGVLAATTNLPFKTTTLIVDGFDRQTGTVNNRDYIRMHARTFFNKGIKFSSTTNEAIVQDKINLLKFEIVDWMLGDESTADDTFSSLEQTRVKTYLESGGNLFVSGAEIGWDLARGSQEDKDFYGNYLKAEYIDDAPNGSKGAYYSSEGIAGTFFESTPKINFDDGSNGSFDVDWPDAIIGANGGVLGFKFSGVNVSNGGAGIYYSGKFGNSETGAKLVYLSFPFETVYPQQSRDDVLAMVLNYFDISTAIEEDGPNTPKTFYLLPNMPNPFNPSTTIRFYTPQPGSATVFIFDINGKQVVKSKQIHFENGLQHWVWDGRNKAGNTVGSGTYFYKIIISTPLSGQKNLTGKMSLIR